MPTLEVLPATAKLQFWQAPATGGGEPCTARLPPTCENPSPATAAVPPTPALRGARLLRQAPEARGPVSRGGRLSPHNTASPATAASLPLHPALPPTCPALLPNCCAPAAASQPAPAKAGPSLATLPAEEMSTGPARHWDPSPSAWGMLCRSPKPLMVPPLLSAQCDTAVTDGLLLLFAHWIQGPQSPV